MKTPSSNRAFSRFLSRLFARAKAESSPPLTQFCVQLFHLLSTDHFLEYVKGVTSKASTETDKYSIVLSILTMALAGDFVSDLKSNNGVVYQEVRLFFEGTNTDTVTAEAIVWVLWLLRICWNGDCNGAVNEISDETFGRAGRLAFLMVEEKTGVDFRPRAIESNKFYSRLIKAEPSRPRCLAEGFASRLMQIVGNRTLDESYKTIAASSKLSDAWMPLNIATMTFFATMPSGGYGVFKTILEHWSDLGLNEI